MLDPDVREKVGKPSRGLLVGADRAPPGDAHPVLDPEMLVAPVPVMSLEHEAWTETALVVWLSVTIITTATCHLRVFLLIILSKVFSPILPRQCLSRQCLSPVSTVESVRHSMRAPQRARSFICEASTVGCRAVQMLSFHWQIPMTRLLGTRSAPSFWGMVLRL